MSHAALPIVECSDLPRSHSPIASQRMSPRGNAFRFTHFAYLLIAILSISLAVRPSLADSQVSFSQQIQPILARKCFSCHGPDEEHREAHLRLDQRDAAIDAGAIAQDNPVDSELLRRILSDDPDEQMPPPTSQESLTENEKHLLEKWLEAGAPYEQHWAFIPPQRPKLRLGPHNDSGGTSANSKHSENDTSASIDHSAPTSWTRNPIDAFVLHGLHARQLQPSSTADRYSLIRRLYLDLVGLPPTPADADKFVTDRRPDAYEQLVDSLLSSPQYGERWARLWLDLARYSDTNGYEKDRPRSIWPYRDWVVDALNKDLPFDQFTIEQLAGDLLPGSTYEQHIATGFHRNTMLNEEGGIDPLEFRFYAMVDRVATTGTVWFGLTIGCAQCHSHKYDPISHSDYYRLFALLNNADEPDLVVPDRNSVAQRNRTQHQIDQLEADLPRLFPPRTGEEPTAENRKDNLDRCFTDWLNQQQAQATPWTVMRPSSWNTNLPRLELLPDGSLLSSGDITKRDVFRLTFDVDAQQLPITALRLETLPDDRLPGGGPGRTYYEGRKGDFFLSEVTAQIDGHAARFATASHSYGKISIGSGSADAKNVFDGNGSTAWSTAEREGEANQLVLNLAEPINTSGKLELEMLFERHFASSLGRFRWSATSSSKQPVATQLPVDLEAILARSESSWSSHEREQLLKYFLSVSPELKEARQQIAQLKEQLPPLPTTMIMQERPADNQRPTFRHHRGEYLSQREEVSPGVPALFPPLEEQPGANRLGLAYWLVSDRNPLTARVAVNQAWQAFFGAGIVESSGDFGTQGDPPSHPELLDWLACEFVDQGWSLKQLHRLIVTSATYRQSAIGSAESRQVDPSNRLLGRAPRFRLDAEVVRDMMLSASGLISLKMGGPGVYPPQPASVTALAYDSTPWSASPGQDRYRRSLYTFSKRTAPFAAYTVFDATSGETCTAKRDRSNTPLQALTLLNDEMYLDMGRALAGLTVQASTQQPTDCATAIFRRLLTRPPTQDELNQLTSFYHNQLQRLQKAELSATAIGGDENTSNELAAWMMVARLVMNLDEAITKP